MTKVFVSIVDCFSNRYEVVCGEARGSVLGPSRFNLYMPLAVSSGGTASLSTAMQMTLTGFIDDTVIGSLLSCILSIEAWMSQNFRPLNQNKMQVMITGSKAQRARLLARSY